MGKGTIDPKKIIDAYLQQIPGNIRVNQIFLFGSYATGRASEDSDLDFVVISPDFKKIDFLKRLELLSHAQGASLITRSVPMDIIGYTPDEFKEIDQESLIMRRAKQEGQIIFQAK